jgi:peptide/nickel transport system substrate-binding protein
MPDSSYWTTLTTRRLSRRAFARGAVLTTGAMGLVLAGCSSSNNKNNNNAAAPSASATAPSTATSAAPGGASPAATSAATSAATRPAGSPTPAAGGQFSAVFGQYDNKTQDRIPPKTTGGTLRRFAYTALPLDTLDPHQTTFGPTYDLHAAIFSKLLAYDDLINQHVTPDLAASLPEQPDKLTYIIKLNPNAKWHTKTPLNPNNPIAGQPVTANDVKYSIERQINKSSPRYALYYRSYQWETVDKIEVVDNQTLRITTKAPTSPFVHFMADSNAFIISQKLVDPAKDEMNSPTLMIGSGPFILDRFEALKIARFVKNPDWHLKDAGFAPGRPFLDAVEDTFAPQDDNTIEGALKAKQVDGAGWNDQTNADRVSKALPGTVVRQSPTSGAITFRFACDHGPMKDPRVRQAVSIAYDRNAIGQGIFQGFFKFSPTVAWCMTRWALPQDEVLKIPGYRYANQADRDADIKMAKQLLDAAGGPSIIGGPDFVMWYPSIPAYLPAYYPQLQKNLKDTLGLTWNGNLDETGYTKLLPPLISHKVDWYWGYDNGWIDLDDWVWKFFSSKSSPSNNTFGLADPDLDSLLDKQRQSFDFNERQQLGYQIQRMLLTKLFPRADAVNAVGNATVWNYVKNNINVAPWYGIFYLLANTWIDQTDPSYQGRPA